MLTGTRVHRAFEGHNKNENSFNQGNFREFAKLLSGIMINLNNF
jgi:hypothetical protein